MPEMTFEQAKQFRMTMGKHKGKTIDSVAYTDEGLRYLDWLFGQMVDDPPTGVHALTFEALRAYLNDEAIKKELDGLRRDD